MDSENKNNVDQHLINNELEPVKDNGLSLFEIEHNGEYHVFHVMHNDDVIAVGSVSNSGFSPDFWIEKDDTFTPDEQLQAVYELIYESLLNDEELSGLIEY